ncbi:phytoene desaturase family protein [Novosphingobium taihuense]|uniref:Pyridine nucleotide-disulfide oxidoreductase domain-containing protein 2 n=1 Tax=Novosphingobium taihuense TaxID=260085 RepID=A0A7W7EVL6_9SPHN|nr:NAD(P)/FAD-dependent oxidoreductase [Novosphingobium taihuense]MBB4613370.1 phytoene dehydrogenase-like protein [Novosphingobium taihuense]TWH85510.1 phytoene dehydrogenase-like protein [Novosphingobium taihuense]
MGALGAADADFVIIGSGINALVCGATLALRGHSVLLLEREERPGGCIRTEELTLPGFLHDTLSTLYPLFLTAPHYAELGPELARHGLVFRNCATPTAVVQPDGASLIFHTDRAANMAALNACSPGDGEAYARAMAEVERMAPLVFGLLGGRLWSWQTIRLLLGEARRQGIRGLARTFGQMLRSSRAWLEQDFRAGLSRGLFAPWVLHVGLSPESTASALMNRLVLFSLEAVGSPMVEGGSARIVEAFADLIVEKGGRIRTCADVDRVLVEGGRARGVRLGNGEVVRAGKAVIASVTPTQLYQRLLADAPVDEVARNEAAAFRYGRGEMQIHLALSEPPAWPDPALREVAMLHLTAGLDAVSRAVNESERGLLPADATIVVAQPVAVDPSRAPDGKWIFWIQLQELPRDGCLAGDALGEIAIPDDGRWTEAVREAYADRIVERLCTLIPNLRDSILARHAISPADLQRMNINLVGGDPYGGDCALDQFMLWRPGATPANHATSVAGLFQIGASTHPGPGLGGMSGYMVAKLLG